MKIPKNRKGKVHLTEDERALPNRDLTTLLASRGFKISKATISRARKSGWFLAHGDRSTGRRASYGFVLLTKDELDMTPQELVELLGVTECTAARAVKRGWFEVTRSNHKKVESKIPERIKRGDLPST
jgi:hypothetical protein